MKEKTFVLTKKHVLMDAVPTTRQTQNYPWPLATRLACAVAADTVLGYHTYMRQLDHATTVAEDAYPTDDATADRLEFGTLLTNLKGDLGEQTVRQVAKLHDHTQGLDERASRGERALEHVSRCARGARARLARLTIGRTLFALLPFLEPVASIMRLTWTSS